MVAGARRWLVAALLGTTSWLPGSGEAFGQTPTAPPIPLPAGPRDTRSSNPPPTLGQPIPVQYGEQTPPTPPPPQPPPPPPPPPPSTPYFPVDPGRDGWGLGGVPSLPESLYFSLELQFVAPHIKNGLTGTVTLPDGSTDTVAVPGTSVDWTVSPRFELGLRLPDSLGAFSVAYRFLVTEGNSVITGLVTDQTLQERLSLNVIDLDYTAARYSPGPRWDLNWWLGARIAGVYFDNRSGIELAPFGELGSQRSSNYICAGGPHVGGAVERQLAIFPEISLFGRLDGGVVIGQVRQNFAEEGIDGSGNSFAAYSTNKRTQSVPILSLQAGLVYKPHYVENTRLSFGYTFERWWNLGKLGDSRGELTIQGIFFRGELDF